MKYNLTPDGTLRLTATNQQEAKNLARLAQGAQQQGHPVQVAQKNPLSIQLRLAADTTVQLVDCPEHGEAQPPMVVQDAEQNPIDVRCARCLADHLGEVLPDVTLHQEVEP